MITAVDTNVLLDVFLADVRFGPTSRQALARARQAGALVACPVVWAEVVGCFPSEEQAVEALETLGLGFSSVGRPAALLAGKAWKTYRSRGGSRVRVVADFLVGAHARLHADRLLTRDRGYFRTYFPELLLLSP